MLLVIDVGNTNIQLGIFHGKDLIHDWRIHTERDTTEDEFNVLVSGLFGSSKIAIINIEKTIISCVVPPMVAILDSFCRKYLGHSPHWVDARSAQGVRP